MGVPLQQFFHRALEAARKALRDLDADQVPADLRKVAGHAGSLTPPLALSLLRGIDDYDWLREQAAEAWPEADAETKDAPDRASALLLLRPRGWSAALVGLASEQGGDSARSEESGLKKRLGEAEAARDELKRRLKDEKGRREAEARDYEARIAAERAQRKQMQAEPQRVDSARRAEIDALAAARNEALARAGAAETELRRVRDRAQAERRRRAHLEAELSAKGATGAWAADPEGLAAMLDEVALMARPDPTAAPTPSEKEGSRVRLRLPEQVLPDSAEALEWALHQTVPITLLVDGYNAGFKLIGTMEPEPARRRLELEADRVVKSARGPLQGIIVYDSTLGGEEAVPPRRGKVEIRFTPEKVIADDRIVELARGASGSPVVITSDRELRGRVEAVGALALWSEALKRWAERRR